jgi:acyl-CoA thioester hydrolase
MVEDRTKKTSLKPFYHDIQVRYGETDQMGIVYHANYIIWFNEARDYLMGTLGQSVSELEATGLSFPVTEVTCRFLYPARYGDKVRVWVEPHFSIIAKLEFDYRITKVNGSAVLCTGTTTNVILDANGKMLIKAPPLVLEAAKTYSSLHKSTSRNSLND